MKFYISTYNCSNQKACNHLFRILPGTIARDLVTKRTWNDRGHSNNVNFVVIITVREILDSIKDLLNGSAPHNRCVIEIKKLRLCSSRFEVESMNIISSASKIYCQKLNIRENLKIRNSCTNKGSFIKIFMNTHYLFIRIQKC